MDVMHAAGELACMGREVAMPLECTAPQLAEASEMFDDVFELVLFIGLDP